MSDTHPPPCPFLLLFPCSQVFTDATGPGLPSQQRAGMVESQEPMKKMPMHFLNTSLEKQWVPEGLPLGPLVEILFSVTGQSLSLRTLLRLCKTRTPQVKAGSLPLEAPAPSVKMASLSCMKSKPKPKSPVLGLVSLLASGAGQPHPSGTNTRKQE